MPLQRELNNFDAWISGKKSYHDNERKNLPIVEIVNNKIVINPLANVSRHYVNSYFREESIDRHPLFRKGFFSIGCTHCTKKTPNTDKIRSGRWFNNNKTECGIHFTRNK